jgi:hypothetical protein
VLSNVKFVRVSFVFPMLSRIKRCSGFHHHTTNRCFGIMDAHLSCNRKAMGSAYPLTKYFLVNIYVTNITVYTCINHQLYIAVVAGWQRSGQAAGRSGVLARPPHTFFGENICFFVIQTFHHTSSHKLFCDYHTNFSDRLSTHGLCGGSHKTIKSAAKKIIK